MVGQGGRGMGRVVTEDSSSLNRKTSPGETASQQLIIMISLIGFPILWNLNVLHVFYIINMIFNSDHKEIYLSDSSYRECYELYEIIDKVGILLRVCVSVHVVLLLRLPLCAESIQYYSSIWYPFMCLRSH